jgi:nucleoside-triphosphatase THEP1
MTNSNIYILSRPIHSGKTTMLQQWVREHSCSGILTPDVDDLRYLYDIAAQKLHPLQVVIQHEKSLVISIGKFIFLKSGFQLAQEILLRSLQLNTDWLIIDEIGRLEIDRYMGLEPAVSQVIKEYKEKNNKKRLLLVIRDYLTNTAIAHYSLQSAVVIQHLNEINHD